MFETLYEFVIGLHDCMIMTLEDIDLVGELMSRSADYFAELVARAVNEGIDALFISDDIAFNQGLFLRPELFGRVWQPHFDRVFAPALAADVPVIFHSDGKIDDAMEMFLDMGVAAITPMDPYSVDYRDYKKRYGHRVTLVGNIDLQWPLATGTPEEVRKDVKEHAEVLMPGGRWVAGSSHSIVNYIPHDNFITMINALHLGLFTKH